MIEGTVTADALGISDPIYTGNLEKKTIYVNASTDCKVYLLVGPSADQCIYLLKSGDAHEAEDADFEWDCNNEKTAFPIHTHCTYLSVAVLEEGSADSTVRVDISGG